MATGKCVNIGGGCAKALQKEVIEADMANFICPQCGKPLVPCGGTPPNKDDKKKQVYVDPPTGRNKMVIAIVSALVLIGGGAGIYFALNGTPKVEAVSLSKSAHEMFVGKADTLTASHTPIEATATYVWSSDNEAVAKVDANGVVTSIAEGNATITVKVSENENVLATCAYTIKMEEIDTIDVPEDVNVESLSIAEGKALQLKAGDEKQLTLVLVPENNNEKIAWRTSDYSVAKVSETGLIEAVAKGKAIVTAVTDRSGNSISIEVSVSENGGSTSGGSDWQSDYATYVGDVKNGKPEGNGTMTFTKKAIVPGSKGDIEAQAGEYATGTWRNGKVNVVTLYQKNGNQVLILPSGRNQNK